jgi:hypothetical protein
MGMAAVIYKKGAPDNFVWEEIKVGSPGRGQVRPTFGRPSVDRQECTRRLGNLHLVD